jgi:hypothetical protein
MLLSSPGRLLPASGWMALPKAGKRATGMVLGAGFWELLAHTDSKRAGKLKRRQLTAHSKKDNELGGEEAKTRDQRPEVRASERVSFIRIAPEINPFHVYEPLTGINGKYDSESPLSDSKITFPFSLQLLSVDVYRFAHEFFQEPLNLFGHFAVDAFDLNKTVGIPRVFNGPCHISTISVRAMLFRARGLT